jgi:hypothetical protein
MQKFDIDAHYGRSIVLNGKDYKVLPVSLRDQIDGGFAVEHAKAMVETDKGDLKKNLDMLAGFIKHYIPELTDEDIKALDWDAFLGLIDYIRGATPEEVIQKNARRAANDTNREAARTTETTD